jgi:hypothetical protein
MEALMKQYPPKKTSGRKSFGQGSVYLAISLGIIVLLAYILPTVLGVNIRSLMQESAVVGTLRVVCGVAIISYAVRAFVLVVQGCTLEGESWQRGLYNALHSTLPGINGLTILLLLIAGCALLVWGIVGIIS